MVFDYHVHSTYSDGSALAAMASAAERAGLSGVGFADHCVVTDREELQLARDRLGFVLDRTYERRRRAIADLREEFDLAIFDAVEMDYDPRDEDAIRQFLADADFDYAVGSVHGVSGHNVHDPEPFRGRPREERREVVAGYFDDVVALVESGLFAIAAHVDIVERNPELRGLATDEDYRRVADALSRSRTVPELNAGRVFGDYGELHPHPDFRAVLRERGVQFVVGSDSHEPAHLRERADYFEALLDEADFEPTTIHD